jgi:hypothetical protein
MELPAMHAVVALMAGPTPLIDLKLDQITVVWSPPL